MNIKILISYSVRYRKLWSSWRVSNGVYLCCTIAFFVFVTNSFAVPINSDVALTPFKGQTIIRSQAKYIRKTDDPTEKDRKMQVWMFPTTFVYGLTEKLAFSVTAPYIHKKQESTSAGVRSTIRDSGIGDISFMSKYRIWSKDLPGEARRISLIGGLELPTGDNKAQLKLGSGSVDPVAGILFTHQSLSQEFDLDLTYQFNTEASNYEFGDVLKYNAAYQRRLWPWVLPEKGVYSQLNLVLELNGEYNQKDKSQGSIVKDSGGNTLFLSPGVQWAAKKWVLETSIQLPIIQDLNGGQLETDYALVTSLRLTF